MKSLSIKSLYVALMSLVFIAPFWVFAQDAALPTEAQEKSAAAESVQPQIDTKASDQAVERRTKLEADAIAALNETRKALRALDEKKTDEALTALEKVTGKLELIVARDPGLALAPVEVSVTTYDLLADLDTIELIIDRALDHLEDGEIQQARPLVANLASEIVIETTSIPLATYPAAIKAIAPLVDDGRIEEAITGLQAALNTLVVTTDKVIPLPRLRAEQLLKNAEKLAEDQERTEMENETLSGLLTEVRNQLKMAELLGYGTKKSLAPMYEQLDEIEEKTAGGKSGKGWFDKIRQQLSELL